MKDFIMSLNQRFLSGVLVLLLVSSSAIVISSEPPSDVLFTFAYEFFEPDITIVNLDDEPVIQITYLDYPLTGRPLLPQIPFRPVTIMLPKDTKQYSVTVETGGKHVMYFPDQIPVTVTGEMKTFSGNEFPESSFETPVVFPENKYTVLDVQYKHGVGLLTLLLHPFQYSYETHTLQWYDTIVVTVEATKGIELDQPFIHKEKLAATSWIELVDNPSVVTTYQDYEVMQHTNDDAQDYDYVLITSETLLNSSGEEYDFYDLLAARESFGLSTYVKTVEDITVEYNGVDTQEKIRNFIIDMYQHHNTTYVLLGGDTNHVPIRMLYGDSTDPKEKVVSSDLYYQCLDGTYNYNSNDKWGELYDGVNGGMIDLHAEVYLGRAPTFDPKDVSNFVEKTLIYEQSDFINNPHLQRVLSAGEQLWTGQGGWGAGYLELCIDHSTRYNQVTDGIPSHRYTLVERYERDEEWTTIDIMGEIDAGVNFINHVGHGRVTEVMKLGPWNILHQLNNEGKYGLFYSQACYSGQVQSVNCIASHWVNTEKKGGFAAIMNSGQGWGSTVNYDGPDNRFAREFYHALFSPSQQISRLGIAHMKSKEANFYRVTEPNMLHVYYNKLLLGCPFVEIKGSENTNALFSFEPVYPITNQPIQFTDESTGWLTLWQWTFGDGKISYQQHPSHVFNYEGVFSVHLKVKDSMGYQSTITKEVEVRNKWPPVAIITPSAHQGINLAVPFSAEDSFDPDGTIVSYQWNFGDGKTATEMNPVHTYSDFGTYQVRLLVTDNHGLMDTAFGTVVLTEEFPPSPPQRPMGSATLGLGDESMYQTQMDDEESGSLQYLWEFGDDGLSDWSLFYDATELVFMNHRWQTGGEQFVRVKARNQYGLESEWSEKLLVTVIDEVPPEISIIQPSQAVYVRNTLLFPWLQPVLIGRTSIIAEVTDEGGVDKVVFSLDGRPVAEVNSAPFEWQWDIPMILPCRVEVRVQAFDMAGNQDSVSFEVFKIL